MKKLKAFENYEKTGNIEKEPTDAEISEKIKIILNNIIKSKQYVKMLKDTTEHVFQMIYKNYPKNINSFISEIYKRDDLLAENVELIIDLLQDSTAIDEIDEIIGYIEQIEKYTNGDNMDIILNKIKKNNDEEIEEEEEEESNEYIDILKPSDKNVEDQLKRKIKK